MKSKRRPRKVIVSRTGTRLARFTQTLVVLFCMLLASCSASQRISVKQQQGEQQQETIIEHGTQIKELSLHFNTCSPSINYPQSLSTSKTLVSWHD